MRIFLLDRVLIRNARKALFSVDVSFRGELQKTSKKSCLHAPKWLFSSTMASACSSHCLCESNTVAFHLNDLYKLICI